MKVTLITPRIGRKEDSDYIRTWQMEPLPIATIAGLTPDWVDLNYFDERMEPIDFDQKTDLVGINVETYTAKRAYEIAYEYHKRGVKTVLGGYHVMLCPDEAMQYADSIVCGYAEGIWEKLLKDAKNNKLKRRYNEIDHKNIQFKLPNRKIFGNRNYVKLHCIETVRGCPYKCDFCSIAAATHSKCLLRPIDLIIEEIKSLPHKTVFFVDDNIFGNLSRAEELFTKLVPLKIKWVSQGSINLSQNSKILRLMKSSGCVGLLVGFESMNKNTLKLMGKHTNLIFKGDYKKAVDEFHKYGIGLYATFVFGYDNELLDDILQTAKKAIDLKFFVAAFNHLIPFPNTPLYSRLKNEKKLTDEKWWLNPNFRYGESAFIPKNYTNIELKATCIQARHQFYSFSAIIKRATNISGNMNNFEKISAYIYINFMLGKEIDQKIGYMLGMEPTIPKILFKNNH